MDSTATATAAHLETFTSHSLHRGTGHIIATAEVCASSSGDVTVANTVLQQHALELTFAANKYMGCTAPALLPLLPAACSALLLPPAES
jgi:hypothetical protein